MLTKDVMTTEHIDLIRNVIAKYPLHLRIHTDYVSSGPSELVIDNEKLHNQGLITSTIGPMSMILVYPTTQKDPENPRVRMVIEGEGMDDYVLVIGMELGKRLPDVSLFLGVVIRMINNAHIAAKVEGAFGAEFVETLKQLTPISELVTLTSSYSVCFQDEYESILDMFFPDMQNNDYSPITFQTMQQHNTEIKTMCREMGIELFLNDKFEVWQQVSDVYDDQEVVMRLDMDEIQFVLRHTKGENADPFSMTVIVNGKEYDTAGRYPKHDLMRTALANLHSMLIVLDNENFMDQVRPDVSTRTFNKLRKIGRYSEFVMVWIGYHHMIADSEPWVFIPKQ